MFKKFMYLFALEYVKLYYIKLLQFIYYLMFAELLIILKKITIVYIFNDDCKKNSE